MNIALMAHDNRKELMVQFCTAYCGILAQHTLCATANTGKQVQEATGLKVTDLLVMGKLSKSKSDARRLIEAGSVLIGDEKVTDVYAALSEAALSEGVVIKKGKKGFVRVVKA